MVQCARARLRRLFRRLVRNERGLELVEVALVAALVVVLSIVVVRKLGLGIQDNFRELCESIRAGGDCSP